MKIKDATWKNPIDPTQFIVFELVGLSNKMIILWVEFGS